MSYPVVPEPEHKYPEDEDISLSESVCIWLDHSQKVTQKVEDFVHAYLF